MSSLAALTATVIVHWSRNEAVDTGRVEGRLSPLTRAEPDINALYFVL